MQPTTNPDAYTPAATPMEVLQFDPARPETHTESRFLNLFLRLWHEGHHTVEDLAKRMEITVRSFNELIRAEAGMSFRQFSDYMHAYLLDKAVKEVSLLDDERLLQLRSLESLVTQQKLMTGKQKLVVRRKINSARKNLDERDYDLLAKKSGYEVRSSLWKFVHSKRYKEIVSELGLDPLPLLLPKGERVKKD